MTLARLRWLTVVAPALFITVFETVRHILFDEVLHLWAGSILVLLVISAGSLVFSRIIFGVIEGMQDEIVRRNQELAARNALGEAVSKALHLDDALGLALEAVLEITRAEAGEILVHEEESGELVMRAHRGVAAEAFREITRFKPETGLPGLVARTGEPVLVQDLPGDPRFLRKKVTLYGFRAFAGVPLRSKNQVVGVMNIASLDPRRITNESLDLLAAIGNQIGVAIENARLMEQMRHLAVLEERDRIGRE
ncbi:MAG TPA: GAF domain-containing protein, partial [Dehalococcoidia bacterium]|nr:GAF domain-containing protein [Dehalococcoidia bacterium]